MISLRARFLTLCLAMVFSSAAACAQRHEHEQNSPEPPRTDHDLDLLIFKDGDKLSGTFVRGERGSAIFRSNKAGEVNVDFAHIQDLVCVHKFAVLRKGMKVNTRNAVIGNVEIIGEKFIVTPETGSTVVLPADEVAYAVDDVTFEHEVARKVWFHEGWSSTISAGATIVRATQHGTELTSDLSITRTLPGVSFLPRRNSTHIGARDTYAVLKSPDPLGGPDTRTETHIFHAEFERNQYFHSRFFALVNYTFDRNFAQGLLAQHLIGGGLGIIALKNNDEELNIKADFHRETQGFSDETNNVTLIGQKFTVEYERSLPAGVRFQTTADYVPSYDKPHNYSANSTSVITVPIYRHLGISFTTTDNYLNNAQFGLKRNTFRFATSLTYSR